MGIDPSARVPVVLPDSTDTVTGLDETDGEALGAEAVEDDGEPFEEKMERLTAELSAQLVEAANLDERIRAALSSVGWSP